MAVTSTTTILSQKMAVPEVPRVNDSVTGQIPARKLSKAELLKTHKAHLKKQDLAPDAPRPVKQPVMADAYAASTLPIRDAEIIPLSELRVETHHRGKGIIVKVISPPYIGAGSVSIVEDEFGNVDKLAIYNQADASILSGVPEGCFVAVKEPYYIHNGSSGAEALDYMICVDHPSDVILLRFTDPIIPEALRLGPLLKTVDDWRTAADKAFLERDYPTAVFCYTEALEASADSNSPEDKQKRTSIHAKRSGTNLLLGRYDAAKADALASRTDSPTDWKAYYNAGRASYGLCDYQSSKTHLETALSLLNSLPNPTKTNLTSVQKELTRTLTRLSEESTGVYEFPTMLSLLVPNQTVHLDRASFLSNTIISSSPHHGRGLFAAVDLPAGSLVFAEKATLMPNQYEPARASAALYALTVRQLCDNPSLAKSVLSLYPGPLPYTYSHPSNYPTDPSTLPLIVDGVPVVDVFMVEGIRNKNCFSLPLSTVENTRPSSPDNRMAKGLWVHASHMNHSCVPNTMRSFVGDVLISRATRDIKAGEEIFQQYVPVKARHDLRNAQFMEAWGFECACGLCSGERGGRREMFERRGEVGERLERLCNKRGGVVSVAAGKGGMAGNGVVVPDSAIRQVDKLARQLEELHEEEVYGGLPRLALIYPCNWLVEAHRGRRNHAKVVKYGIKVLRNFGFVSVPGVDAVDVEGVEWEPRDIYTKSGEGSLMTIHVVAALRKLAEAYEALGKKAMAERCVEAAKFGYTIVTGFENDLGNLDM